MKYHESPYFHVGRASDLEGRDRRIYRFLEILPGLLSWGTIIGAIVLSFFAPVIAAICIIAFDLYWLLKTIYLSLHHYHNWRRLLQVMRMDWSEKISHVKYEHLHHMIILPFYNEGEEVIRHSLEALKNVSYDLKKFIVVLGVEERAGDEARDVANKMHDIYKDTFGSFVVSVHPKDLPGEMPGKGSNISYAAERGRVEALDVRNIPYEDVIVSAFDIDTVVHPQYFLCLTWHFVTTDNPYRASFQPVPLYNNNLWEAPALSRVAALSSTYWQMIEQERPERITTFSSHSVSFKTLYEIGYWQKNMVSEDSRIFWNLFLAHDGDYRVVPIAYPVSMDANLAPTYWQTMVNIYKQHRRWSWGVENVPYILFGFLKNKAIPLRKKLHHTWIQLEGFWSLATNPLIIILLGWMPLILGGREFNDLVVSYNLPVVTRNLMILAMSGLVLSAIIAIPLVPVFAKGKKGKKRKMVSIVLQWILVPITIVIFGAIPGLDSQTRLMFGQYMGFWVTPKHRSNVE